MKLQCDRKNLLEVISNVQKAVSSKSTIPALEGILIEAEKDQIRLFGYDLEIGITTQINANVEESGKIIVNARLLSDIIRKLPDDNVFIETDDNFIVTIKSGLSEFSIIGMNGSEYPELPSVEEDLNISIDSSILKSMIKQTIFAVSVSDNKPVYTGTLFEIKENIINLVSIDGCRLAKRTENLNLVSDKDLRFIVPGKTLNEILKLISEDESDVEISLGTKHIIFNIEDYTIISRLLEGDFLDYNSSIPNEFKAEVLVDVNGFIDSIERVSLLITEKLRSPVRCIFDKNEIKLSCMTSIGKAHDEINISMSGQDIEIGFNNKYLLDALKNSDCDQIRLFLKDPVSPVKILPKEGESFLFLVLPVRL